jgi:hypothetical protein
VFAKPSRGTPRRLAHQRDARNLQAKTAQSLRRAEQSAVLASVALRVLLHAAAGNAKQRDLYASGRRDQAAIVAAAAHHRRRYGRHDRRCRLRPRSRACAVVIDSLVDVVAIDVGASTNVRAEVAVQILRRNRKAISKAPRTCRIALEAPLLDRHPSTSVA